MSEDQDLHIGIKILCLIIPLVGLVLYFVHRENDPVKSKSAGVWALAGFLIGVVFKVLF